MAYKRFICKEPHIPFKIIGSILFLGVGMGTIIGAIMYVQSLWSVLVLSGVYLCISVFLAMPAWAVSEERHAIR